MRSPICLATKGPRMLGSCMLVRISSSTCKSDGGVVDVVLFEGGDPLCDVRGRVGDGLGWKLGGPWFVTLSLRQLRARVASGAPRFRSGGFAALRAPWGGVPRHGWLPLGGMVVKQGGQRRSRGVGGLGRGRVWRELGSAKRARKEPWLLVLLSGSCRGLNT